MISSGNLSSTRNQKRKFKRRKSNRFRKRKKLNRQKRLMELGIRSLQERKKVRVKVVMMIGVKIFRLLILLKRKRSKKLNKLRKLKLR